MNDLAGAHLLITGRVQGVGYRYFAEHTAASRALKGWVRNLPDGSVECEVEGPKASIEKWIGELRTGPPMSRVEAVQVDWRPMAHQFEEFTIR